MFVITVTQLSLLSLTLYLGVTIGLWVSFRVKVVCCV